MGLALLVRAIVERLDRIEAALGITEPTAAQAEYEAWAAENDDEETP